MHLEYKVMLPDHGFPIGEKHKLIPSVYAACLKKDGEVSYNGPTFISIRSRKHDKSCAATHSDDFERIGRISRCCINAKQRCEITRFVLVDDGPDEAPKNQQA